VVVNHCAVKAGSYNAKVATAAMIEVIAAVAGASISVAAMGAMGFTKRNDEARDAVIRLTSAVEHIAAQLEILHGDIRDERKETFGRLNGVEQRVSKLEAKDNWVGDERRR
jgi:copper(I)-binding protein